MDQLIQSVPGGVRSLGQGSETIEDVEKINLIALVAQQQMALSDYKERYKDRKKRCTELEEHAKSCQEKASYYEAQLNTA